MKWDSVHITDKIHYLKAVVENSTTGGGEQSLHIVNALITGSLNTFSGDMGFEIQKHHMDYMRELWDTHIKTQKDNSVIDKLREKG